MTQDVVTVNKTQTIKEISELVNNRSIRHVPVVFGKEVIGMLSTTGLQKISSSKHLRAMELQQQCGML